MRIDRRLSPGSWPAGLVAFALALTACVLPDGDEEELSSTDQEIINGTVTYERPAIGALRDASGQFRCTATLIEPNVILTAGHCLPLGSCSQVGGTCAATLGWKFVVLRDPFRCGFDVEGCKLKYAINGGRWKNWGEGGVGNRDIGIIELRESVPATIATPIPVKVNVVQGVFPNAVDGTFYGATLNSPPSTAWRLGKRDAFYTTFGAGCTDPVTLAGVEVKRTFRQRGQDFHAHALTFDPVPRRICPGDSGGPSIYDGDGRIHFVTSGVSPMMGWGYYAEPWGPNFYTHEFENLVSQWRSSAIPPPPPTCSFSVSPSSGSTTTRFDYSLSTTNSTGCTYSVDGRPATAIPCAFPSGSFLGSDFGAGNHTILIAATGLGGSVSCSRSVSITALPPPSIAFQLSWAGGQGSSITVPHGTPVTLSWAAVGAASCTWGGAVSGSAPFSGAHTTTVQGPSTSTISLTCTNPSGTTSRSATVTVLQPPPTVNFALYGPHGSGTTVYVPVGGTVLVNWWSSGATSCAFSGAVSAPAPVLGSYRSAPLGGPTSIPLTLTCTNAGGSRSVAGTIVTY